MQSNHIRYSVIYVSVILRWKGWHFKNLVNSGNNFIIHKLQCTERSTSTYIYVYVDENIQVYSESVDTTHGLCCIFCCKIMSGFRIVRLSWVIFYLFLNSLSIVKYYSFSFPQDLWICSIFTCHPTIFLTIYVQYRIHFHRKNVLFPYSNADMHV